MALAETRQMESQAKQMVEIAALKQRRTRSSTVCENVLTWSTGAARVRHANATIDRSFYEFELQHAGDRRGHHSALLLLRRGRGDHAAAFDFAGLLSGSGGGIPGKNESAPNAGRDGHGADPDRGTGRGRLRAMDAHRGFRRKLAEIQQSSAEGGRRRGTQNQGDRRAGRADRSGARVILQDNGADGTEHRAHADLPRDWLPVRAVFGSYVHALPGFFHAGGKARALARDVATLSRLAAHASKGNAGRVA